MSKSKSTRSSSKAVREAAESKVNKSATAPASFKFFCVPRNLVGILDQNEIKEINLEWFFHPGKGCKALFAVNERTLLEVVEYTEPRRSWFFNNNVCSNGRFYMMIPVDTTFLAIYHFRKFCSQQAIPLDNIYDEEDRSTMRLFNDFIDEGSLKCIADVKRAGDQNFYKFNHNKTMAWLAIKAKRLASALKDSRVYCGHSAISQNFAKSEESEIALGDDMEYLRMATEIVGEYIEMDLLNELQSYLEIPSEPILKKPEDSDKAAKKRKSKSSANQSDEDANAKKIKLTESENSFSEASTRQEDKTPEIVSPSTNPERVLKEKVLTTKEKALAKSAKGTKSIMSFFQKV